LYVPTSLEWIVLRIGGCAEGYLCGPPAPPLEEMLRQSRTLPQTAHRPLDDLLALARQTHVGYVHRQEEIITLDGEDYVRWVFCEPYFPLVAVSYQQVEYEVPVPTTVYAEGVMLDVAERLQMASEDHVLFATGEHCGVATARDGMFLPCAVHRTASPRCAIMPDAAVPPPTATPLADVPTPHSGVHVYTSLL